MERKLLDMMNQLSISEYNPRMKYCDKFQIYGVYIMRVIISIILMVIAALVGFFFGAGMNEAMGGAILLSMITGFACTINAIEKNKKD